MIPYHSSAGIMWHGSVLLPTNHTLASLAFVLLLKHEFMFTLGSSHILSSHCNVLPWLWIGCLLHTIQISVWPSPSAHIQDPSPWHYVLSSCSVFFTAKITIQNCPVYSFSCLLSVQNVSSKRQALVCCIHMYLQRLEKCLHMVGTKLTFVEWMHNQMNDYMNQRK